MFFFSLSSPPPALQQSEVGACIGKYGVGVKMRIKILNVSKKGSYWCAGATNWALQSSRSRHKVNHKNKYSKMALAYIIHTAALLDACQFIFEPIFLLNNAFDIVSKCIHGNKVFPKIFRGLNPLGIGIDIYLR